MTGTSSTVRPSLSKKATGSSKTGRTEVVGPMGVGVKLDILRTYGTHVTDL